MKNKKTQKRKTTKKATKKKIGFFAFLFMIAENIVRAIKRGPVGFFFADLYTKCNEKWKKGYIYNLFRRKKQKIRERATFSHIYEESLLSKNLSKWSYAIIHSHLRIWGVGMLFFAFSVIGTAIIRYYFLNQEMLELFVFGAIIVLLSLPLIISRKELGEALLSGRLTRFVITNVLNLNPMRFEKSAVPFEGSYLIAILFSVALGFLSYFSHPIQIINIAIMFVLFVLLMSYPELGLIFIMIILPFANVFPNPSLAILMLLGFSVFGFIVKLLRGKRVIKFELIDILVLSFSILLLFGGIFTCGGSNSLHSAEVYFAFLLVYFLIVNMYIGKPSIYRAFKILIVTATIVSAVGIVRGGAINESWVDLSKFGDLPGRVSVFLGNPNMLGAYLLIVFPLTLGQMKVSAKKISKFMYFIAAGLIFACIVMTGSRGAWIGVIAATIVFWVVYNFKNIWLVLVAGLTIPLWQLILPEFIINRFSSIFTMADSSVQMRLNIWKGAWAMAKDNLFTGIGVGERAFRIVYNDYTIKGAESAVHSHSLILQILVEIGIVGLIVFAIIMFMCMQKSFIEIKQGNKNSKSRTMITAGLSAIIGALVMGLTDNIWYNYRVFIIFWIVVALTVSLSKNNVRERESTRIISNMTTADLEINR